MRFIKPLGLLLVILFVPYAYGTEEKFEHQAITQLKKDLVRIKSNIDAGKTTAQELRDLKESQKIERLVDFLPLIIKKFPHINAMVDSRAFQDGTPQYPRILLMTFAGDLVVTFNGHPSQRGYESLEMIEFNWDTLKFEMSRITFRDDEDEKELWLKSLIQKNSEDAERARSELSVLQDFKQTDPNERNHPLCLSCHRGIVNTQFETLKNDPQPLWDPYNFWPGAANENEVEDTVNITRYHPVTGEVIKVRRAETPFARTGRYAFLPKYNNFAVTNSAFTESLYFLNLLRVFRIMTVHPQFEEIRKEFAYIGACPKEKHKPRNEELYNFLNASGLSSLLLSMSFQIGPGNSYLMPANVENTIRWVFLRDKVLNFEPRHKNIYAEGKGFYVAPHLSNSELSCRQIKDLLKSKR